MHDAEAQETRISATILEQPWSEGASVGTYTKLDFTPTSSNLYKVRLSVNGGPFEPVLDGLGAELAANDFRFQVSYLLRRRGAAYRVYDDPSKAKDVDLKQSTNGLTWEAAEFNDGRGFIAEPSGTGFIVGWYQQTAMRPSGVRLVDNRAPAMLETGQALYVDALSTATPLPILQGPFNAALKESERAGRIRILVYVAQYRMAGLFAPGLNRALDKKEAARGISAMAAAINETHSSPLSWDNGRAPFTVSGQGWYHFQPTDANAVLRTINSNVTIDLTHLPQGRSGIVNTILAANFFAGEGSTFAGQENANHAAVAAGGVYRVTRLYPNRVVIEALAGTVAFSTIARPAMDRSILWAGQSHSVIGVTSGSIGGFTNELMSGELSGTPDRTSTFHINGATGGTAAVRSSVEPGTNYWWDDINDQPGPVLLNCVAKINEAVALGQPLPSCMIWKQGDGDANKIETGTITMALYQSCLQKIWEHLRTLSPNMRVITCPPGSVDSYATQKGMLAVRLANLNLTGSLSWAHYGSEMYDVPRNRGNGHPTDDGYHIMGIRDALAYQQIMNGVTVDTGPMLYSAAWNASQGTLTVSIRGAGNGGASAYAMPVTTEQDEGPFPYGLWAVVGDPATSEPIPMLRGTMVDASIGTQRRLTITLYPARDPSGGALYSIAGWAQHMRRRSYPMSEVQHGRSAGLPIKFRGTSIISA